MFAYATYWSHDITLEFIGRSYQIKKSYLAIQLEGTPAYTKIIQIKANT